MKKLKYFLDKFSSYDFINIEKIIIELWLNIDYLDFSDINAVIIEKNIWVNKNLSLEKQRFALAHELCHFLLNEKWASTGFFSSCDIREKRADKFATNLLLPTIAFVENWEKFKNIPTLSEIFVVPEKVIEFKIKTLLKKWQIIQYD